MGAHYTAAKHRGWCSEDPLAGVDRVGVPGTRNLSAVDQQEISMVKEWILGRKSLLALPLPRFSEY